MDNKKNYIIIGGDNRINHLANMISQDNNVFILGHEKNINNKYQNNNLTYLDNIKEIPLNTKIDFIVLPIISTRDNVYIDSPLSDKKIKIEQVINIASDNTLILAGNPTEKIPNICKNKNIDIVDYFDNEKIIIKNAVATVEGAIQILIKETDRTIFGQKCLVMGYGRIGKLMSKYLSNFKASVDVCARSNEQLTWAEVEGINSLKLEELINKINKYDIIVNTVPYLIFKKDILDKMKNNVFILDLASPPGGIDFEYAKSLKIKTNWALLIPGKTAPVSSAEYLFENIQNIVKERS